MPSSKGFLLASAGTMVSFALLTSIAFAGPIEDRQAAMKSVGDSMKVLAAIAKKEQPFDAAVVKQHGDNIAANFAKAKDLFPDGSEKGEKETYAKPEVFSDKAGFQAAMTKGHDAAVAMAAVTAEAGFLPALQALGGACKGCHDKYRRPVE